MLTVIIPALNEEATLAQVVTQVREELKRIQIQAFTVVVVDNGSTDKTVAVAKEAGAKVLHEPRQGYGSACLAALKVLPFPQGWVCFMDGDGADDPRDLAALLKPLQNGRADMVLGSRILGQQRGWVEKGALSPVQRFGNQLSGFLISRTWGVPCSDLGPFRAVKATALARLQMDDPNFGWTVQMQARAARLGLKTVEVPVHYRRRQGGQSKISGTVKGSILAGTLILKTYVSSLFWRPKP